MRWIQTFLNCHLIQTWESKSDILTQMMCPLASETEVVEVWGRFRINQKKFEEKEWIRKTHIISTEFNLAVVFNRPAHLEKQFRNCKKRKKCFILGGKPCDSDLNFWGESLSERDSACFYCFYFSSSNCIKFKLVKLLVNLVDVWNTNIWYGTKTKTNTNNDTKS